VNVAADLGWSNLKAVVARLARSAYASYDDDRDLSGVMSGDYCPRDPRGADYPSPCWPGFPFSESLSQDMWYSGLTLASSRPRDRISWLAGAGYVSSYYSAHQDGPGTAAQADDGFAGLGIDGYGLTDATRQLELHGMLNARLSEHFEALFGARIERASSDSTWLPTVGLPAPPDSYVASTVVAPRASLTLQPNRSSLVYATLAKGYRMGGSIPLPCNPCRTGDVPQTYEPDSLWNIELGTRSTSLDGRLQVDLSLFHMVWHDIQTQVYDNLELWSYLNAGRAVSDGFDLGAHIAPTERLTLTLLAAYANARYTSTEYVTTQVLGRKLVMQAGDALGAVPEVSPPWAVTAIGEYLFRPYQGVEVTLRAQDAFTSRNSGPFTSDHPDAIVYAPGRRADPSVNRLDLSARAGNDRFDVSVFINNVLDSQPTLQYRNRIDTDRLFYATTLRPRTVGVTASWRFGLRR
jgi:outer membrane receptor protein involved in Fe transport